MEYRNSARNLILYYQFVDSMWGWTISTNKVPPFKAYVAYSGPSISPDAAEGTWNVFNVGGGFFHEVSVHLHCGMYKEVCGGVVGV